MSVIPAHRRQKQMEFELKSNLRIHSQKKKEEKQAWWFDRKGAEILLAMFNA